MKRGMTYVFLAGVICLGAAGLPIVAAAQSATTYAAGNQWGTTPGGIAVNGAYESALTHNVDASIASAVNAARSSALVGLAGSSLSISSVGSQTVVSNTVSGTNITSSINASQSSSNSGAVSNTGTINSQ